MNPATEMTKAEKKAAYEAWYIAEVDKGLADIKAGRVLSAEEAESEVDRHMAELFKKHGKQAA